MGLLQSAISRLEKLQALRNSRRAGDAGRFFANGGNDLLYDLPVKSGEYILDGGGYMGEWTFRMVALYGCRSVIFEPVPRFFDHCCRLFSQNSLVSVESAALGQSDTTGSMDLSADGSSLHGAGRGEIQVKVVDAAAAVDDIQGAVACLKLNIEGGEYDVLERLVDTGAISKCRSLLVQFHRQPEDWKPRYAALQSKLATTHKVEWKYEMVWERWTSIG